MNTGIRNLIQLAGASLLIVVAVAWLSGGCERRVAPGEGPAAGAPAPPETVPVRAVSGPAFERASGTVHSTRHTTVSSKLLARIESIAVRSGSVVAVGDRLVTLDARDLEARVRESEESLRATRAELALARSEHERVQALFARKVASQQEVDRAVSAAQVAKARVQAAEQRLADAKVGRSFTDILSPVAGRVVERLAEPGDIATPGAPILNIYDPGALRLEVPVRESLAVNLTAGRTLDVEIDALGARFQGAIEEIVPFAEPGARTLLVKVRLPSDSRLFAGMFGRLAVPAGERTRLLIPASAVERVGQLAFVQAVGPDGRLERRIVTTGHEEAGDLEVLSGLRAGERVLAQRGA